MKTYNTGISKWNHGQPTDYYNGVPSHKLLGPCPDCGSPTFNYGGGWRCNTEYCNKSASNPSPNVGVEPAWWNTDINVNKDGNAWCAFRDRFTNLQENIAGFGDTPNEAVKELIKNELVEVNNV